MTSQGGIKPKSNLCGATLETTRRRSRAAEWFQNIKKQFHNFVEKEPYSNSGRAFDYHKEADEIIYEVERTDDDKSIEYFSVALGKQNGLLLRQ